MCAFRFRVRALCARARATRDLGPTDRPTDRTDGRTDAIRNRCIRARATCDVAVTLFRGPAAGLTSRLYHLKYVYVCMHIYTCICVVWRNVSLLQHILCIRSLDARVFNAKLCGRLHERLHQSACLPSVFSGRLRLGYTRPASISSRDE